MSSRRARMKRSRHRGDPSAWLLPAALLAACASSAAAAAGSCVLARLAELPVTMAGTRPLSQRTATQRMEYRGLEPGEAELEPGAIEHRPREAQGAGGPVRGELRELRPAGIGEPEELGSLVEGLPGRVIAARAKHPVLPERRDLDQECVAAGYQERHVREGRRIGLEERGEQMSLEMMHAEGGDAPRVGETPRERGTGQERPDEPGAGGVGDP